MQKFWQLLNWPASHGRFWPKLWMPLATVFVDCDIIKRKNWRGFRPYLVTLWREFEISVKKAAFWKFLNKSAVQVNVVVHGYLKFGWRIVFNLKRHKILKQNLGLPMTCINQLRKCLQKIWSTFQVTNLKFLTSGRSWGCTNRTKTF